MENQIEDKAKKFDELIKELKDLTRNLGKSNMIDKSLIEKIIVRYG